MSIKLFLFLLGRTALLAGAALLLPLVFSLLWQEPGTLAFGLPALFVMAVGILLSAAGRQHKKQLTAKEGAFFMALVWLVLSLIGMLPYVVSGSLGWVDAFFESVSAFTTTGASCLPGEEGGMRTLIFWHSIMEWLGGLNFIVLLVTVLPQVSGCFGMTLSVRQTLSFSPVLNRMEGAALQAAKVYLCLTLLSGCLYWLAGLDKFDSFTRALTTLSTSGGGSALDFMQYNSPALELAGMLSMLLASGNFLLYWKGAKRRDLRFLLRDTEMRAFGGLFLAVGLIVSLHLWHMKVYGLADSLRFGFFQAASFMSTSGFASAPYGLWPDFDRYVLLILVFVGGCIGSTTGGLKTMRFFVLFKMAAAEMRRTLHPHMVIQVKVAGESVSMKIVGRILSFFFLYMAVFFLFVMLFSLADISVMQAMGLAAGCLSSIGSAAGLYGLTDFSTLPSWTKLSGCLLMFLGRLEIFSFLILLHTGAQRLQHRW